MVRCADGTLYTGIAIDVDRRLREHQSGKRGSKYLRGRGPFELVFQQQVGDRAAASSAEHCVKQLGRSGKEALITGRIALGDVLAQGQSAAAQASGVAGE